MSAAIIIVIGFAAGLHAALYGAYKDSPHESFLLRRFVRELVFATAIAALLAATGVVTGQTGFVVYVSVFALSRIVTEFWKLFLRVEPQHGFRIPTQMHGGERMFAELLFKILVRGYVPGKFRSMTGPFQAWMTRRRYLLAPYAVTWLLFLVLFFGIWRG